MGYSPTLVDRIALNTTTQSIKEIAVELSEVISG
jgi:hypothetical protein